MPNTYFQFKQFRIEQDCCAMKVCTDACLFGAWAAAKAGTFFQTPFTVLDIGAGTGLLSLMMAQGHAGIIDALEIERSCAEQAGRNVANSPWAEQIRVRNLNATGYKSEQGYDLVISNPPFYENDLASADQADRIARHSQLLTLEGLAAVMQANLLHQGVGAVLLPYHRTDEFLTVAWRHGLHLKSRLSIRHSAAHNWFRSCLLLGTNTTDEIEWEELTIRQGQEYTGAFRELLQPFYLHL